MQFRLNVLLFCSATVMLNDLSAQITLLNENFNAGIPATWAVVDADGLVPHDDVSEFTDGWISYESIDTSVASTSYYDTTGQSQDYLILPKLSLMAFSKLVWSARSVDASYPDSYYVLVSTTDSLIASFTDTIFTMEDESYLWQTHSVHLDTMGYATQDIFIAFRNFTTDGFILELDDIKVTSDDNAFLLAQNQFELTLFPNPASDILNIRHNLSGTLKHEIFDSQGRMVYSTTSDSVNISGLAGGIYMIRSCSGKSIAENRFVKL